MVFFFASVAYDYYGILCIYLKLKRIEKQDEMIRFLQGSFREREDIY